ncbi:MAG TPA: RluA family pseudouridine synthase [Candidatus Paceibacterota bacterium]
MEIPILYEDSDILAIDKPAGLVVHSDGKTKESSLTDWILEKYPQTKDVGESIILSSSPNPLHSDLEIPNTIERPGIVHRLDRETSGVLLIAKTKKGHAYLKEQFKNHTILKKYLALVHGELKEKSGIINRPIGRSKSDFRKWSSTRGTRGEMRTAETKWTLLDSKLLDNKEGYSLLEVEPKTGRTHQIRVHMKTINHPIVHDKLYGPKKPNHSSLISGLNRMALHAMSVSFINCAGKNITINSQLPYDFRNVLNRLDMVVPNDNLYKS